MKYTSLIFEFDQLKASICSVARSDYYLLEKRIAEQANRILNYEIKIQLPEARAVTAQETELRDRLASFRKRKADLAVLFDDDQHATEGLASGQISPNQLEALARGTLERRNALEFAQGVVAEVEKKLEVVCKAKSKLPAEALAALEVSDPFSADERLELMRLRADEKTRSSILSRLGFGNDQEPVAV